MNRRVPFPQRPAPVRPAAIAAPMADAGADKLLSWLKGLVWLYFFFLLFEGAFRKWGISALSTPLLLIRDPVVVAIYALAIKAGRWPKSGWVTASLVVALVFLPVGLLQLANGNTTLAVLAYGLRTNFLHLPLIWVMAEIFDAEDVKRIGKWTLLIALPMAVLMVLQFKSPAGAALNKAIGDGVQLDAIDGKIRPAGTFSFVTGAVDFAATVAAFLLVGAAAKKTYPFWLVLAGGLALGASLAVSGSRSAILASAIVLIMFFVTLACTGRLFGGVLKFGIMAAVAIGLASSTGVVNDGLETLAKRTKAAGEFENQSGGMIARIASDFTAPFEVLRNIPALGLGIGRGTNVGAQLLGTPGEFLLAEGEWARVVCESGPLLGFSYLLLRILMTCWLGVRSFRAAFTGNPLPLLLFGSCARNLVYGQFGPATSLGFAVFVAGLTLAATREREEKSDEAGSEEPQPDEGPTRHERPRRQFRKPRFAAATGGAAS
ncbi:MAG: hypothetical protein HY301_14365 [Verrucomicrobia bacterium]|nr:hypothetical protein [Verrucomicrobiota bacterium]